MALSNSQLDNLGDRLRADGPADDADRLAYDEYRASFTDALLEMQQRFRPANIPSVEQSSRLKTIESAQAKLRRGSIKLSQMDDIAGVRIIVPTLREQELALKFIRGALPLARVKDRRAAPSLGYRAIHIIGRTQDRRVELQLRTEIQNSWANTSEDLSRFVGIGVKYGLGPGWAQRGLLELSSVYAALEVDIDRLETAIARLEGDLSGLEDHDVPEVEKSPQILATSETERLVNTFMASDVFERVKAGMLSQRTIIGALLEQALTSRQ